MNSKKIKYNKNKNIEMDKFYMTTILAINCIDGLVIASDGQATLGAVKRSQEDKIYYTKINDDVNIILAGSGLSAYTSRFFDFFEERKNEKEINSPRDCADLCEDVARELRNNRYPDFNVDIIVCVGLNKNDKVYFCLYTLDPVGIAEKENNYNCIGSGSTVVEYILSRLWYPGIGVEQAKKIAIYAIEEVKKVDTYSGGYIRVALINGNDTQVMDLMDIISSC
jgi:20S proteasome alpha/beta subunit